MIKKVNLITAIAAILLAGTLEAQNKHYISVAEAIDIAVRDNSQIKMAELEQKTANARYRQTDAIFLPSVDLGYTALSTNNPLNAFGFLLQQQTVTAMDFNPGKLNNPGAVQDYSAKVNAKLPLLNMDMIYSRRGAKAQEEMYKHKTQRTKEYIEFEVKKAYTQLQFSYMAKNILSNSLNDVKLIYESVNNFYYQGLIQKSDLLNAQVQVNTIESALSKAESSIQNASDGLALLMGTELESTIYISDTLSETERNFTTNEILTNRADIRAMEKAIDATDMMVKSSKMAYLPRINAFGTYQLNDSKPFGFHADSYLIGINLTWNIFSGNLNRSKIKTYQYQRDRLREEQKFQIKQSKLEIEKTNREINDLQIEINKHTISVEQSEEALRIQSNRHKEGLVSTTDLLMSQAQLSQQKLLQAQAVMTYNIALAYLIFLSK